MLYKDNNSYKDNNPNKDNNSYNEYKDNYYNSYKLLLLI